MLTSYPNPHSRFPLICSLFLLIFIFRMFCVSGIIIQHSLLEWILSLNKIFLRFICVVVGTHSMYVSLYCWVVVHFLDNTAFCLSIHQLMDILILFNFWLLCIMNIHGQVFVCASSSNLLFEKFEQVEISECNELPCTFHVCSRINICHPCFVSLHKSTPFRTICRYLILFLVSPWIY
jgi:hypothetical protein